MYDDPLRDEESDVIDVDMTTAKDPHPLQDLWPRSSLNKLIVKDADGNTVIDHLEPSVSRSDIHRALDAEHGTGVYTVYAYTRTGRQLKGYATVRIDPTARPVGAGFVEHSMTTQPIPHAPTDDIGRTGDLLDTLRDQHREVAAMKEKLIKERDTLHGEMLIERKKIAEEDESKALKWITSQRSEERKWLAKQRQLELSYQERADKLQLARDEDRQRRADENRVELERRRVEQEAAHRRDLEGLRQNHQDTIDRIKHDMEIGLKMERERDKLEREREREKDRREIHEIKRRLTIDQIPIPAEMQAEVWERKMNQEYPRKNPWMEALEEYGPQLVQFLQGLQKSNEQNSQQILPLPTTPEKVEIIQETQSDPFDGIPDEMTTED